MPMFVPFTRCASVATLAVLPAGMAAPNSQLATAILVAVFAAVALFFLSSRRWAVRSRLDGWLLAAGALAGAVAWGFTWSEYATGDPVTTHNPLQVAAVMAAAAAAGSSLDPRPRQPRPPLPEQR